MEVDRMSTRHKTAQQNREILLESASYIFRLHGINAPLQLVIQHAQVGRATFYRNFVDRRDLVIALIHRSLQRLEQNAIVFGKFEDGLFRLIQNHIHNLPALTALAEYWRVIEPHDPIMLEIYQRRNAILQPLIDTAIKHRLCRPDLSPEDYAMITAIMRSSFQGLNDQEQKQMAERAVDLLLDGIRVK